MQQNSVEFFLTVEKGGQVIARRSFKKPLLVMGLLPDSDLILKTARGESLLTGVLYWRDGNTLLFQDAETNDIKEFDSVEQDSARTALFSFEREGVKLQVLSSLTGEVPAVTVDLKIPSQQRSNKRSKIRIAIGITIVLFLIFGVLGARVGFRFQQGEPKEDLQTAHPTEKPHASPPSQRSLPPDQKVKEGAYLEVLKKNRDDIEACQLEHPFQDGRIEYRVRLNAAGEVKEVTPLFESVYSDPLVRCLTQKISAWFFPATDQAGRTIFFTLALRTQ